MFESLAVFALVFTASAATPGPDTLTIFGRALSGGRTAALPFTVGVALGKLTLLTLVMLGMGPHSHKHWPAFLRPEVRGSRLSNLERYPDVAFFGGGRGPSISA